MKEKKLLKAYTGINKDLENPILKILVSYIKPSFLFKTDVLTPIHLGRSVEKEISKDGIIPDEAVKWLHENCIGDDDFEGNISSVNRRVGFLTGTYWAWKNYDKLGNPVYFGSFGYRRLFDPHFLKKLQNYDVVLPKTYPCKQGSIKKHMIDHYGSAIYEIMLTALKQIHLEDVNLFEIYMNQKNAYFLELYVMKKHIFFAFCEWIFPLLFLLLQIDLKEFELSEQELKAVLECNNQTGEQYSLYKMRDIGFIIERLTGFYLYKLVHEAHYNCLISDVVMIKPRVTFTQKIEKYKKRLLKTNTKIILNNK